MAFRASTSSSCVTTSRTSSGTSSRRCPRSLTRWSRRRAKSTSRRSAFSPVASSFKTVRDQLEKLVQEMLDKGVLYDDARREFEKMFIARALQRTKGNLGGAADMLGLHRNTIARKIAEYRIKRAG